MSATWIKLSTLPRSENELRTKNMDEFISPETLQENARIALEDLGKRPALKPKERMQISLQPMPCQSPAERVKNMSEVAIGYFDEQARVEAMRCLQCPTQPCVKGCPVEIDIPGFLKAVSENRLTDAIAIIKQNSLLPAVCGRVCPQEEQCQSLCTVGKAAKDVNKSVAIGRVERFVADWDREHSGTPSLAIKPPTGKKVAVIGSGPASITVAADVRREGHDVTIFEAFHKLGGVLLYGIPEFRLPKKIVDEEVLGLQAMGVHIETNFVVGRTRTLKQLIDDDGFDAVFVGTGAGLPKFMGIPGENLVGVFSANEYLTRSNLMKAYHKMADTPICESRKVAIVGGGNVAMDSARTAMRLGASDVYLVYRRSEQEMPARVEEVHHAKEEGIQFKMLTNPVRILGNEQGLVTGMECLRYELGEPDASGRRKPVAVKGSEFLLEVDTVIIAIGNESNPLIRQTTDGLETNPRGNIVVDETGQTSMQRVFAGGDIVLGAATVILAMGEGRKAAASINKMLVGNA